MEDHAQYKNAKLFKVPHIIHSTNELHLRSYFGFRGWESLQTTLIEHKKLLLMGKYKGYPHGSWSGKSYFIEISLSSATALAKK